MLLIHYLFLPVEPWEKVFMDDPMFSSGNYAVLCCHGTLGFDGRLCFYSSSSAGDGNTKNHSKPLLLALQMRITSDEKAWFSKNDVLDLLKTSKTLENHYPGFIVHVGIITNHIVAKETIQHVADKDVFIIGRKEMAAFAPGLSHRVDPWSLLV